MKSSIASIQTTIADDDDNKALCRWYKLYLILMDQMRTFSMGETESQIAQFLIGSIDDTGYIRRVYGIVDDLAFTENMEENQVQVLKKYNNSTLRALVHWTCKSV